MTELRQNGRRVKPNTKLFALRIDAGLGRRDLGARVGVSAETIRLAELGFVPGPRIQAAIAAEFKMTPLEIWPLERQRALV